MYERSAIVLERYVNKIFEQKNGLNIKSDYEIYKCILEGAEKYKSVTEEEENIITQFDKIAQKMQSIQKEQEKICLENIKKEESRNKMFNNLEDEPEEIEKKLLKIEEEIEENSNKQKELRQEYIKLLQDFSEKQKERNACSKNRRIIEGDFIENLKLTTEKMELIETLTIKKIKEFILVDSEILCKTLNDVMMKNGENERIPFDKEVIIKAVQTRIDIAKKESECYINIYDKLKKLISELENDNIKINKHQKTLKDVTIKLSFLEAEKQYIVNFLDNERMTSLNGEETHKKMMKEACKNFENDMVEISKLYELIIKETTGKSSKKAYKELYNATYLQKIQESEENFNKQINEIKANVGTIINVNYWRIEGIKNIFEVFDKQIEEEYERDLSEFKPIEEKEENEFDIDNLNDSDNEICKNDENIESIQNTQNTENIEENKQKTLKENEFENKYEQDDDDIEEWFISNDELKEKEEKEEKEKFDDEFDEDDFEFDEDYDEDDEDYYDEDEDDEFDEDYDEDEDFEDEENNEDEDNIKYDYIKKDDDSKTKTQEKNDNSKGKGIFGKFFK